MGQQVEPKRYRILGVLGRGGFGKVYRARLEGPEGFTKDVAIKLMKDELADEDTLKRFRDEARILGLVRDRAIVSVDPPMRLKGKWAVVMEYVDGTSADKLLDDGPVPPTVSLEIVQEVARALDKVYRFPGPQGSPLELLHRDLKPANLQITPFGEVKILDFGTAKATFRAREAKTTVKIAGTQGYIAPERMMGMEGPAGDIYSLGVVLQTLLSGRRPTQPTRLGHIGDDGRKALVIAKEMQSKRPHDRPGAREVEDRCQMLRRDLEGPTLREWAEQTVPGTQIMAGDALTGHVLTETTHNRPIIPTIPDSETIRLDRRPAKTISKRILIGAATGLLAAVVLLGVFGIGFGGLGLGFVLQSFLSTAPPPPVDPEVALAEGTAGDPPAPEPEAEPAANPTPSPEPSPAPAPRPAPPSDPTGDPSEPAAPNPPAPSAPDVSVEELGVVEIEGGVTVELRTGGEVFAAGPLADGAYEVWADFGDGMTRNGTVAVSMGVTRTVKCSALKMTCQVR